MVYSSDVSHSDFSTSSEIDKKAIAMAKDESALYKITYRTNVTKVLDFGYNAGVGLLHLDRLRRANWTALWTSALQALWNVSTMLPAAEQDIFNVVIGMHKELFYPLPCVWNVQLNNAANMSTCPHSRNANGLWSGERPDVRLLHMNRREKFEFENDDRLQPSDARRMEKTVNDRLIWYKVERKAVTLLNGNTFMNPTAQLPHEQIEKIFQQLHSNVKLPTSHSFCTGTNYTYGFCVGEGSTPRLPRMHAYYIDKSQSQEIQVTEGTTLAICANVDSILHLEQLTTIWTGPISVAVCATDREAFRLPRLLRGYSGRSRRNNIVYHIVYTNEGKCSDAFAHNGAVAFSLTSHVLVLKDVPHGRAKKALSTIDKYIAFGKQFSRGFTNSTVIIFIPRDLFKEETKNSQASSKDDLYSYSCQPKDKVCQFKILKHAFAMLLPVEISLVPADASADSFFDYLLWSLLNTSPAASSVLLLPLSSASNVNGRFLLLSAFISILTCFLFIFVLSSRK